MSYWRKPGEENPPNRFIDAVCRFYTNVGSCRNGDSCSFFHSLPDHRRGWKSYPKDKLVVKNSQQRGDVPRQKLENSSHLKTKVADTVKLVGPQRELLAKDDLEIQTSWAVKEVQLLRQRNRALEAQVKSLQQNSRLYCQRKDSETARGGTSVDDYFNISGNPTANLHFIDLQPQIDDLIKGNDAMEDGIRAIRECLQIPSSPSPPSSPVQSLRPKYISHLLPTTLDLSSPTSPMAGCNASPATSFQGKDEEDLCTLLDSLRISPLRAAAPGKSGDDEGSDEDQGHHPYLQPPECFIL